MVFPTRTLAPPGASPRTAHLPSWAGEFLLVAGLTAGALAIRLPCLMLVPGFSDEYKEMLVSFEVARGARFPLVSTQCYLGSFFNYLLGAIFVLFGPSFTAARMTVTVLGALTVPLAYWLGKETEDRPTGVATALLMLTSFTHIINGHTAWVNCTTPFFATAAFLLFTLALKRSSGRLLVAAGFCFGLALQTHPTTLPAAPALALAFLHSGLSPRLADRSTPLRTWLRSPWPYAALLAALLAYGNVIAYNVLHPTAAAEIYQKDEENFVADRSLGPYLMGLASWSTLELSMLSSEGDGRSPWWEQAIRPKNLLCLALLAIGTVSALRRGKYLPVYLFAATTLLSPLINNYHRYPMAARYGAFVQPVLCLLVAAPLVRAGRAGRGSFTWGSGLAWGVVGLLVLTPTIPLAKKYRAATVGRSPNRTVLALHETIRSSFESNHQIRVVLDSNLENLRTGFGGRVYGALDCLLQFDGIPFQRLDRSATALRAPWRDDPGRPVLLVLFGNDYQRLGAKAPPAVELAAHPWLYPEGSIRVLEVRPPAMR